ncbi:MAG TPA: 2-oxoglutarate dehydrogenase complex dihydrolipoyllysine-residue succinyltransferase [Gemmataceae bacterium]|nr:2-oxoglutarate dehydrogenase complex dihydrolipoyllysine-residue succinyltransferase [Gemmataceae bacterium]
MAVEIKVPSVGESISEGTISRWLKKDGEAVRADEPLLEVETEKATTEVSAPEAGTLRITVPEGKTVSIGAVVGRIEPGKAEGRTESTGRKDGPASRPAKAKTDGTAAPPRPATPPQPKPQAEIKAAPLAAEEILMSPSARHLVQAKGVDVRQLTGTGPSGRITKEDVLGYLEHQGTEEAPAPPLAPEAKPREPVAPPSPPPPATAERKAEAPIPLRETRQRLSSIRLRIAERLVAAQHTAAILTTFNEADLSAVMTLRDRYKEVFRQKHGVNLGFMSFFVRASIEALRAFPVANAWIDGSDAVYHHEFNIGVAVSTEKGLIVPVLRNAEQLSFADIEKRIAELAQKAREGKITVDDLQGGTFTITNGGVFGSLLSTPILNPPQSAILGMHAIQRRPVAIHDQVVIRPMMYLALSYDHRLIDGREAVQFLVRIKECIEDPERMLLAI